MITLAVDTAGPVVGVAAIADEVVLARTARVTRGADALLLPWADELVRALGGWDALGGIVVSVGPGAFTGLRVGIATAAGLAMARGVPVVGLDALRHRGLRPGLSDVLVVLDARKSRVYAARYLDGREVMAPCDVALVDALAACGPGTVATGEGAVVFRDVVQAAGLTITGEPDDPAVDMLARLGAAALAEGAGVAPADVAPTYLRPADARLPAPGKGMVRCSET